MRLLEHWNCPVEPPLKTLKTKLGKVMSNLLYWSHFKQRRWNRWAPEVFSTSVMQEFSEILARITQQVKNMFTSCSSGYLQKVYKVLTTPAESDLYQRWMPWWVLGSGLTPWHWCLLRAMVTRDTPKPALALSPPCPHYPLWFIMLSIIVPTKQKPLGSPKNQYKLVLDCTAALCPFSFAPWHV